MTTCCYSSTHPSLCLSSFFYFSNGRSIFNYSILPVFISNTFIPTNTFIYFCTNITNSWNRCQLRKRFKKNHRPIYAKSIRRYNNKIRYKYSLFITISSIYSCLI
jgi:hypothetical protein